MNTARTLHAQLGKFLATEAGQRLGDMPLLFKGSQITSINLAAEAQPGGWTLTLELENEARRPVRVWDARGQSVVDKIADIQNEGNNSGDL